MADNKTKSSTSKPPPQGAIINENGEEVPITDEMIQRALDDIKPKSIGWRTGMMGAITDEMLERRKTGQDQQEQDKK